MKKIYMLIALMMLALTVAACGATNNEDNLPQNSDPVETDPIEPAEPDGEDPSTGKEGPETAEDLNSTEGTSGENGTNAGQNADVSSQDDMQAKMDELDYADFELEVDYGNHKEYEAELEKSSNNSVKAEIEDDLNNVKKKGTDAFNELYPLVQQLTINGQTSQDDAIKEVLKVFNLPADYNEFDLEIRLKDGSKIEFEDRK